MDSPETATAPRRIIVAIDASRHGSLILECAAGLAAAMQFELAGLFVEDINLLRLAELPFASEIAYHNTAVRGLDKLRLEQALRRQSGEIREQIHSIARRRGISHSFQVLRGQVATELLGAALNTDILVLGKYSEAPIQFKRAGTTALTVAARATLPVLIIHDPNTLGNRTIIVYDEPRTIHEALPLLQHLLSQSDKRPVVVLYATEWSAHEALQAEAAQALAAHGISADYRQLPSDGPEDLIKCAEMAREGGLLVLPKHLIRHDTTAIQRLLEEGTCSLLLV